MRLRFDATIMHFYRFVRCKAPRCLFKWYVVHQEFPTPNGFIHYPEQWFPIEIQCARCKQTFEYGVNEIESETSHKRLHPHWWKPLLPNAPAPEGII